MNQHNIIMPIGANIPDEYVVKRTMDYYSIVVPSRSVPGKFYHIKMVLDTRQLSCDCDGFHFRGDCAHIRALIFLCYKNRSKARVRGMNANSLIAFYSFQPGELGARQGAIFDFLSKPENNLGRSNKEISAMMSLPINTVTPRIKELREMGLVVEYGTQVCPKTGRPETVWGV